MAINKQASANHVSSDLLYILLLLFVGLLAYANSFFASFYLDDYTNILRNKAVFDLSNLRGIFDHCPERFLTYLTLAINYRIGGEDPLTYHIFNFFIHFSAALFLYLLAKEICNTPALRTSRLNLQKNTVAFAVAAIFLLHPLQTQSVTYVIQRAESMAGMFYLATLYFYVRARLENSTSVTLKYYVLTGIVALGAAFSKETAVTLPAMIGLFEVFLFETSIRALLRNKILLLLLIPAFLIIRYKLGPLLQKGFFYDPGITFTRKQYLLTQFSVLVTYLRLFFYPVGQNIDWYFPVATSFFARETIFSFLVLLALLALAFAAYRRFRLLSLGIIGFFVTLAPTSTIIPIKDVIFEHRMYLAVAFLALGCVQVIWHGLGSMWQRSRPAYLGALVMVILTIISTLTALTYLRNEVWLSEVSLWRDAVEKSPDKARPHNNYGKALYLVEGRMTPQAEKEFEIANRLDPAWAIPWHNLAVISFLERDYKQAIDLDLKALEREPDFLDATYQLAKSYRALGKYQEAQEYLERLIADFSKVRLLPAYLDLIELYLQMGEWPKALHLARELTQLPDSFPGVDYYRGLAWYRLEDFRQAEFYFNRQTAQQNKKIAALLMLGQINYLMQDTAKAEVALRQILAEQPWSPTAHYNLSVILETTNRRAEARKHLEIVVGIQPLSLAPRIRLIRLYDHLGEKGLRLEAIRSLLGLRSDSTEFSFLKAKEDEKMDVTLRSYEKQFLEGNPIDSESRREKTRAIIATLTGDLAGAMKSYENYVSRLDDSTEIKKYEKEIQRLQTILHGGKEPMEIPA
jgi:tetratricopeptide (TPR) repeat protein